MRKPHITPRTLRIGARIGATALLTVAGLAALALGLRPAPAAAPPPPPAPAAATDVTRIMPAPLMVTLLIDASGSMAASDPNDIRYEAASQWVSALAAARPSPMRSEVLPIYFGTSPVQGATIEIGPDVAHAVGFDSYLGDTDFEAAVRSAIPHVRTFRSTGTGVSGRAVVAILTDGFPDLPGSSSSSLWPGIESAIAEMEAVGGEVYLLGFSEDSEEWRQAADRWRATLGDDHVLLASDASGLNGLYTELARTALDLGVVTGSEILPGEGAVVEAGPYTEQLVAQVTAVEAGATFSARSSAESSSTPMTLSCAGEQVTMRYPADRDTALEITNTGDSPLMVALSPQTVVLTPSTPLVPCVGAPIEGILVDLRDGRGGAISSVASDPLSVKATLTWSGETGAAQTIPLQIRPLTEGRYEARAADALWPEGQVRMTVLTRSVSGIVGRADYSIEPTTAPWPSLERPGDLYAIKDANSVEIAVALAAAEAGASSTGVTPSVSAEVLRPDGSTSAAMWLTPDSHGEFTGTLPGADKDAIVRLTIVGNDGAVLSARDLPMRLRKTPWQTLLSESLHYGTIAVLAILVLCAAIAVWLLAKPPLAGSLVVKGGARPQRFNVGGQRYARITVEGSPGTEPWLVLPATRASVRVLKFGLIPSSTLLRRGIDHPFRGRSLRLT